MKIDLTQLISLAPTNTTEDLTLSYTPTFVDAVFTHLHITPTEVQRREVSELPKTGVAVGMIIEHVRKPVAEQGMTPKDLENIFVLSVARAFQASHPAATPVTVGEAKEAPTGPATAAAAASVGMVPPPPPSHLVVGASKDSGAGVGFMALPPATAHMGAAPFVPTGGSSAVYPAGTYIAPILTPTVAPTTVVVASGGAGAGAQAYAPVVATGCTWADCCQCCACLLSAEQQIAVGYTQGVFVHQLASGGPVGTDVAIGALAGGRPGFAGAVGNHYAQQVFCRDLCHCCGSMGCCSCSAPTWTCAAPTIGCPDISCPAVTCDGNPCQPAVDLVGGCFGALQACGTGAAGLVTNCFGFFTGALGGCGDAAGAVLGCITGAAGGCGDAVGAVAGCIGGAAGGCGEALGACAGCAECCCAVVGAIGGR